MGIIHIVHVPYILFKNGTFKQYDLNPDSIASAGSIGISINEISNWLKFQVADTGYYNGVQIVSKECLDETHITAQLNN